jgi:hypothetical protein
MHSNQQNGFTLVIRLVKGEESKGEALAAAFFARLEAEVTM